MKPLSCAKHQGAAVLVGFCHCSPVLHSSSISYCQRCFERDLRDLEIQAPKAGYCVCLFFFEVPSATTSQSPWVPLGSPIRQTAFWVGSGQHSCSSAADAGECACEKTPVVF